MDILEYVGRTGTTVKRVGNSGEYRCICLLHHETKPSMYINPSKGQWNCQGCGKGGGLLQLIMLYEGVSYQEAVAKAGTDSSPRVVIPVAKQDPLTLDYKQRMTQAVAEYADHLNRDIEAMRYLTEERGLSIVTIIRYLLGLCPEHPHDIQPPLGDGHRPTLAGHITIPDMSDGYCAYMQGRRMTPGEPRYMGLSGLPKPLYGFGRFRNERTLYLVEGPFDWLTLLEWGLPAVSSLGSHLSPSQQALLYDKRVVLAQDADTAGDLAAEQMARNLPTTIRLRPPEPFKDWNDALIGGWKKQDFSIYMEENNALQT